MIAEPHLQALKEKHAALDHEIAEEELRPHPDELRLAVLKKQKLRLKDEMARLAHA
jgi:uncharacterized protein